MRFSAAILLFTLSATLALAASQDVDYEYGDDGTAADEKIETRPPPPPPPLRRPGVLSNPRKSPLSRSRPTPSTAPPPPPPAEDPAEIFEGSEHGDEEEGGVTAEPSTKKPLIRGGVRPFRSNQDLLEILKRRRLNVKATTHATEDKGEVLTPTSGPVPSNLRRRYNGNGRSSARTQAPEELEEQTKAPAKSRSGRRFNSARSKVVEELEDPQPVSEEPRSRSGRRRF